VLYTRCHINGLLAGILVIPSLYSVTYRLMGERPIDLPPDVRLEGGLADPWDIAILALLVLAVAALLAWFFRTALGVAMRATGDNPGLVRGCGVEVGTMTILGLALANGLAGVTGALLVQHQGAFHLQIGVGMIVWGLASVLIGEALWPGKQIGRMLARTVAGALLFRLILASVVGAGLHASDLKLFSALFVLAALLGPRVAAYFAARKG
jgi:putative ABC transport system permease protein